MRSRTRRRGYRAAAIAATVTVGAHVRGARAGAPTIGARDGVTPNARDGGVDDVAVRAMPRASLGFALADVMPDVVATALPHGPKGWPWVYGSVEFKTFTCKYDETLGAVDPSDPNKPQILLRFGTYGGQADTQTDQYTPEWFDDPEHAADIQWTYRLCDDGEVVACEAKQFGQVDPFPSIEHGAPGKRCQYLDTRNIKAELRDSTQVGPEGDRKDADSLNAVVEMFIKNKGVDSGRTDDVVLIDPKRALEAIKAKYPEMAPKMLRWDWCAHEGETDESWCQCNTLLRFGWTGSAAERAPSPADDPDFVKWIYADLREEDNMVKCSADKFGGVVPWPDRPENTRICQCLNPDTMNEIDDALADEFGGPVDFIGADDIPSTNSATSTAELGKATTLSRGGSSHATSSMLTLMTVSAAALAFVVVRNFKTRRIEEYEPLLETTI